ncbi:MAG: hypothetical protein NC311_06385 [Muribaculaceae bacterium]|nr:hypothetical protein [Muribaculaceae bacterium]
MRRVLFVGAYGTNQCDYQRTINTAIGDRASIIDADVIPTTIGYPNELRTPSTPPDGSYIMLSKVLEDAEEKRCRIIAFADKVVWINDLVDDLPKGITVFKEIAEYKCTTTHIEYDIDSRNVLNVEHRYTKVHRGWEKSSLTPEAEC